MAFPTVFIILKILSITIPLLISVAYFTVAERKIMGAIQRRRGPDVVGFMGLLQAFEDGLKLFVKETTIPSNSNIIIFLLAPILSFLLSLISWAVIPFSHKLVLADINLGILYLFSISSFNIYGIVLAGWSSNSKYVYLGGLRPAAQMISYEISIGFVVFLTFYVLSVSVLYYFSLFTIESNVVSDNLAFFNQFLLEILLNRTNLSDFKTLYLLMSDFDVPTVYEFESIFDQSKTICEHLNKEELNSSSSSENSDFTAPIEMKDKYLELLEKELLKAKNPNLLPDELEKKYQDLLKKGADEKYKDLLEKKILKEENPVIEVKGIEKYREIVKQLLEAKNPDLLITDELVTKYLERLEKEIQKAEDEYFSVWLFYGFIIVIVTLKVYFAAISLPDYYEFD